MLFMFSRILKVFSIFTYINFFMVSRKNLTVYQLVYQIVYILKYRIFAILNHHLNESICFCMILFILYINNAHLSLFLYYATLTIVVVLFVCFKVFTFKFCFQMQSHEAVICIKIIQLFATILVKHYKCCSITLNGIFHLKKLTVITCIYEYAGINILQRP